MASVVVSLRIRKQETDTTSRTDNAEIGSEDDVEERISERSERSSAASQLSGDKRRSAYAVLNERWRGAVGITAAVELYQMSAKLRRMQAYLNSKLPLHTFCCSRLCVCAVCLPQRVSKFARVWSVWNHKSRPRIMVKMAQNQTK